MVVVVMVDGFVTGMVFIAMGLVMGDGAAKVFAASVSETDGSGC
jgi:hypothetical protein